MNFTLRFALAAAVLLSLAVRSVAADPDSEESATQAVAAKTPPLTDPTILLLRDENVRTALACTDEQQKALNALFGRNNRLLLAMRDVGPTGADETAQPALKEIRSELKTLLNAEQRTRLQGLILQAQGYDSLLRKDIAAQLKLTPKQLKELAQISAEFREQAQALQQPGDAPRTPEEAQVELKKLQAKRHKQVMAQLDKKQQARYGELLGEPFDFAQVRPSPGDAPEFAGPDFASPDAWINSEPITMESLRGRVVVVHFFAFGCSNCINNYPWYREWHDAYAGQDVTIIGIHTPETPTETDNDLLAASIAKHQLKFPVAVDKEKKMWTAWYNGIWPSVYIIDRQGRLRYWWYGELDWQGAGNQKVARQQIELLLAENAEPATSTAATNP